MRYLIDTNVLIRYANDKYGVSDDVQEILSDYENIIYVSSESLKEFIHLVQEGRIILNKKLRSHDVFDLVENELGFHVKFVSKEHLQTLAKLKTVAGHNDPSYRLIISQSITENFHSLAATQNFRNM